MNNVQIMAFGACRPEDSLVYVSNDEISKIVETTDDWVFSRTGMKGRYISKGANTSELCAKAGQDVLERAGITADLLDIIIVATVTSDYAMPSTSCIVQSMLGAKNAFAFDVSAACSGFVYGIAAAEKFLRAKDYRYALVLGGETMSKMLDWADRGTCVLFGDGAAGVLLCRGEKESFLAEDIHSDGDRYHTLTAGHIPVQNPFSEVKGQTIYSMMQMDGRAVFDFAVKTIPGSIMAVLKKANVSMDEVQYIVPHQANYRIVEALARKLKVETSKFYTNMQHYANTSAASIPLALAEMEQKGLISIGSGQKILLTGFGGGLTWGSVLVQI